MKFPTIKLPAKVTRALNKVAFKTAKAKPGICIAVGIILGGTAIIMCGIDTWKNKDRLSKCANTIKDLKKYEDNGVVVISSSEEENKLEIRSAEEQKNLLVAARKEMIFACAQTYWKEVALGVGAIFFILHGKKLYKRQIAELGAMYSALLQSYRQYRQNVIADLGAEKDQEYAYGLKKKEIVDAETGEVTTVYDTSAMAPSIYSRVLNEGVYDESSGNWIWLNVLYSKNKLEMERQIRWIQNECNDILTRRGYLTLNEVYDKLYLPQSEAGQHVGWVKGGFVNGVECDDFVDFGVFPDYAHGKYQLPVNKLWLNQRSNQAYPVLDFNVVCIDGIWDDVFEYNNRSSVAYNKRAAIGGYDRSKENLNRWFLHNDILEEDGI